jgi:MFS family permease
MNEPAFGTFSVFRNRGFALLWTAQSISTAAVALSTLAAGIVVFRATDSALNVGLMMMATVLPSLCLGMLGGVAADRWDRRRILIVANLLLAAVVIAIPFLAQVSIVWLYVIVLLLNAITQFFNPANVSLIQEAVPDHQLAAANSFMGISSLACQTLGFAASGVIAAGLPIDWAFWIVALALLVSAACNSRLRGGYHRPVARRTILADIVVDFRIGGQWLVGTPTLRSLFLIYLPVFVMIGFSNAALLPFSQRTLHTDESGFGLLLAMESLGAICSSLLLVRCSGRLREGQWMILSFLGMGMAGIAISQSTSLGVGLVSLWLLGATNAPSVVMRQLLITRNTPSDVRGRVTSSFFLARDLMYVIGMACVGLADHVELRVLYIASWSIVLMCGLVAMILPGLGPGFGLTLVRNLTLNGRRVRQHA